MLYEKSRNGQIPVRDVRIENTVKHGVMLTNRANLRI